MNALDAIPTLTLSQARSLCAEVLAVAEERRFSPIAVAAYGRNGLLALQRMEAAPLMTVNLLHQTARLAHESNRAAELVERAVQPPVFCVAAKVVFGGELAGFVAVAGDDRQVLQLLSVIRPPEWG